MLYCRKAIRLPERWPFATRFRARIILQNKSAYITMFLGIFLASVLLFFGTMFSPLLDHFQGEVTKSKFANYQYILKEPAFISWKDGEKYAVDTVKNAIRNKPLPKQADASRATGESPSTPRSRSRA